MNKNVKSKLNEKVTSQVTSRNKTTGSKEIRNIYGKGSIQSKNVSDKTKVTFKNLVNKERLDNEMKEMNSLNNFGQFKSDKLISKKDIPKINLSKTNNNLGNSNTNIIAKNSNNIKDKEIKMELKSSNSADK